jgi:hypothetical protein
MESNRDFNLSRLVSKIITKNFDYEEFWLQRILITKNFDYYIKTGDITCIKVEIETD